MRKPWAVKSSALRKTLLLILGIGVLFFACRKNIFKPELTEYEVDSLLTKAPKTPFYIPVEYDVPLSCYFDFMDTLVQKYDSVLPYQLSEHLLVHANPSIIYTLENTDYYLLKRQGIFNYDNRELIILEKGDSLIVPDVWCVEEILEKLNRTVIDLNIPEFKLRIIEDGEVIYTFPVRVGRNERKYLAMAGKKVDLRTKPGVGKIIRANLDPDFINPSNCERFTHTRRDDGETTLMPLIPWLEPMIDGRRYGHLIHPTTNPKTLGKAYSNGCVGVRESDAWRIYYHAPVGTKVVFRYDLEVTDEAGVVTCLEDIYGLGEEVEL